MADEQHTTPEESLRRRFEVRDAPAMTLVLIGLGLALIVFGVLAFLWWFYGAKMGVRPTARETPQQDWSYTEGHLVMVVEERKKMEQETAARMTEYAWMDREAGIARIPVDRALDMVSERGLPEWAPEDSPRTLLDMIYEKAAEQK